MSPPNADRACAPKCDSARLDILTAVMSHQSFSNGSSPCDSVSPLDERAKDLWKTDVSENVGELSSEDERPNETALPGAETRQEPHFTFQLSQPRDNVTAKAKSNSLVACSPRSALLDRSYRPSQLELNWSHGLTTASLDELRQRIAEGRKVYKPTTVQLARPKPDHYPKTPATPSPLIMGNKPSSIAGSPAPDNASTRSVVRNPVRALRKSSANLAKHIDSKSRLPPDVTGTVIRVHQQVSSSTLDGVRDENDKVNADPFIDLNQTSDELHEEVPPQSASTVTITDENAFQHLSASTTIRESEGDSRENLRPDHHSPYRGCKSETDLHQTRLSPDKVRRDSALSPSIPAPSPLPEDSPHKYGLKDRADTPDMVEPEEINVAKARRRSSGIDIFNEAKSLQSASSFLNGLSTSRRRAESGRGTDTSGWTTASYDTQRPRTSRGPRTISKRPNPTPQNTYSSERCRGHIFKPSGFSYSRPLSIAQLKCYRNHANLLPSRNKKAPVECAVCHIDDDREHYSCNWCALRMCRFCRSDFAERGMAALKERIKQAELGNPSPNSSSDDLTLRRPKTSYV